MVLVLITALVGPFFIDWTIYRSTFETYASRVLGHRVTVLGEADLRLLPAPYIRFSDVRVGEAEDPLLVVSRFDMRVELPPLLKGEFRVVDMALERPHLTLSLDEAGRLDWLTAVTADGALADLPPEDVALEKVTIRDGAISVIDARTGETHSLDNGNLAVSARTLAGPFRADGSLTLNGSAYTVSLASGRIRDNESLRLKGDVTPTDRPVTFSFDGALSETDAAPRFDGAFDITSVALDEGDTNTWSVDGQFSADIAEVAVPEFEFRFGPEDKRLAMTGEADLVYTGDRRFEVRAQSKQVDLDRLLGGGPQAPVEINAAGQQLVSALRAVPLPTIDGALSLDVPAVVAGGGIIQNVRLDLETMLGGWRIARLAGRLPGRTMVATQGDLGLEPALTYRGAVSVRSDQPATFFSWWQSQESGAAVLEPVAVEGRLNLMPAGAALDNLRLTVAGSEARGGLAYREPRGGGNAEFSLSLDADTLDLDQMETLTALMRPFRGATAQASSDESRSTNVSLRLQAREVRGRGVAGEGLAFEAEYADGNMRIDRLFAADLAGARIDVTGDVRNLLTAPSGAVSGTLDARDLSGLMALVKGVIPDSTLIERLEKAADSLVPAQFDASLQAAERANGTDLSVELNGTAGGTEVAVRSNLEGRIDAWHDAEVGVSLSMTGADGSAVLQQLGLDVLPVEAIGEARILAEVSGVPANGLDVRSTVGLGDTKIETNGTLTLKADEEAAYALIGTLETPDLTPLALLSGRILPVMAGDLPATITATVEGVGTSLAVPSFSGTFQDTRFDGRLEGDLTSVPGERNRRFNGELNVSQMELRALSELVLGPDQWYALGDGSSVWPTAFFGAPLLDDLDVTLDLRADDLYLDEDTALQSARAEFRLTPLLLRLDGLNGTYAGGKFDGNLSLRRSEAEGAASGRVKLTGADLRQLSWRPDGRAVVSGTGDLYLEFEGIGRSIAAIVAGLNGGGSFTLQNGTVQRLNPQAFLQVTRAVDAGLDLQDDKIEEVFLSHMSAGSLPFEKVEGTLTLVGGRLSARNVVVDAEKAEVFGSAQLDLNTYDLDADFSLKVDPGENAVTGAEPQIGLLFEGPVEAPARSVDITPFTAYLTLRAFEQEVERVERLQAEILERDRLTRELKRQSEAKVRREREAIEAAAAAEAAAQAAEEERLRLEQERLERESQEQEQTQNSEQTPAVPDTQPVETAASPANAPADDPIPLTDRIRAVLDASNDNLDLTGASAAPETKPASDLPPLDGPITIEDLLSGQFGIPAGQ